MLFEAIVVAGLIIWGLSGDEEEATPDNQDKKEGGIRQGLYEDSEGRTAQAVGHLQPRGRP